MVTLLVVTGFLLTALLGYVAHRAHRGEVAQLHIVPGWAWVESDPELAESVRRRLALGQGVLAAAGLLSLAWLGLTRHWATEGWLLTPATWGALAYLVILFAAVWQVGRVQQLADRLRARDGSGADETGV
jgi:hypothetical protein